MKVVIVEDEKLATDRLITLLHQYDPSIEISACFDSVEDTVQYLRTHSHPDLLLLDIHLSDSHSFEIFKQINYSKPVIFTTAFDQYALEAFRIFSIDYILKPVTAEALTTAIEKYKNLIPLSYTPDFSRLPDTVNEIAYKKRFLGKVGQRLFFINITDIAYFQADNKLVHLVDKENNRYVVEYTMEQLEKLLNPKQFFRLNRSFLVSIDAVQQVKPWYNSRLKLTVKGQTNHDEMVVSRERVAEFKQWAEA